MNNKEIYNEFKKQVAVYKFEQEYKENKRTNVYPLKKDIKEWRKYFMKKRIVQTVATLIVTITLGMTVYAGVTGNLNFKNMGLLKVSENFDSKKIEVKKTIENDYVKIIARPIFETAYSNVYYHGSPVNNINKFKTPSFWSSDINFAEQYGKWVYIAQLDLSNCFDLSSKSHYEWLESKVGKIKYYDDMYNIHYYNSWMDFKMMILIFLIIGKLQNNI